MVGSRRVTARQLAHASLPHKGRTGQLGRREEVTALLRAITSGRLVLSRE